MQRRDIPIALRKSLRRMTLITGENFAAFAPAAALLEQTGHPKEAQEFPGCLGEGGALELRR